MAEIDPNDTNLSEVDFEIQITQDGEAEDFLTADEPTEEPQTEEALPSSMPEDDGTPAPSPQKLLGQLLQENEDEENDVASEERSLKEFLRTMNTSPMWILRTVGPIAVIIAAYAAAVITLGYQANSLRTEHKQLKEDLQKWHDLSLASKSDLAETTRQSQIEERLKKLGDSTLVRSTEAIYNIPVEP